MPTTPSRTQPNSIVSIQQLTNLSGTLLYWYKGHNLDARNLPVTNKWAAQPPPHSPFSSRPQTISKPPTSGALNKWTRSVPTQTVATPTVPTTNSNAHEQPSRSSQRNPQSVSRTDPRLQRDVAPHKDLQVDPTRPPDSRLSRSNQQDHHSTKQSSSPRRHDSRTDQQQPEGAVREKYVAPEPGFIWTEDHSERSARPHRTSRKERGSLLSPTNQYAVLPRHSKQEASQKRMKTKKFNLVEKQVSPDVYIPTTVSVGTLARLLGVRLGKCDIVLIVTLFNPPSQNICNVE